MAKTELSEDSVRSQHASFMKECPSGEMSKEKFVELSEVLVSIMESLFLIFLDCSWR